ncbi:16S rRNA (guanine(527)-N(7))-methyltransferase RsmG [Hydrogenibacillus schlegelii]|uniref:Ribosomal RNA small subunit methyltransferase G n=1 Tax=Hydrogenibacillus schlegelii TaxID=1484 RepID=A0A132N2G1_HYDSH|nr:16S rRNA (guanine(527)-N(7))-methyltransferase RsmG [Hydrogenibacillus schlegelii]KWX04283.1 hypothetical protein TR75_08340 [Hydrogenibacillus schlegelii]MBT9282111.1 16S rRNA (guanine(527)-N(7))-methyltransferase RsmG [Hydrogenibacillus schlegelii]OAR04150.1 hypothetical protein SA87_06735 [Hydrogenibacillus schlegelii]PTQ54490.1 MAG: rRNA small subunit 7-methylguanosine (m7G) methyltransferase GidB [Hydrogenibacillus schlegelii]
MVDIFAALENRGLPIDAAARARLGRYIELLLAWNERMNLTAITEPEAIWVKHIYDSLTVFLSPHDPSPRSVIDVGTGAGFPGLPMKIVRPELSLVLLDAREKRLRFLEAVVADLGLQDVRLVHGRAEVLGRDPAYRDRFDLAVARAVAPLSVLAELFLPFVRPGGLAVAWKGERGREELAGAGRAITALGAEVAAVEPLALPGAYGSRVLLWFRKVHPTPERYPRRPGEPERRPLR